MMGGCSGMIFFARNFSGDDVTQLSCQKFKAAVKTLDHNVIMVLTAPANEADTVVKIQLEKIYEAFRFYNGSYSRIKELYKDSREQLLSYMEHAGNQLIPIVMENWQNNLMKPFGTLLTYVDLPAKANRHFLTANQLLNAVQEISDREKEHGTGVNYGGCILFNSTFHNPPSQKNNRISYSILLTQLDLVTTRCIISRVEYNRKQKMNINTSWQEGLVESEIDYQRVFLLDEQLKKLRKTHLPVKPATDSESESESESLKSIRSNYEHAGEYVGLCIVSYGEIALAFICSRESLLNQKHLQKTKLFIDSKLDKLEHSIRRAVVESPTPNKLLNKVKIPRLQEEGRASWYHFMTFDHLTEAASGSSYAPEDRLFISQLSDSRNIWNENPEVCQILLRDHKNGIFARRVQGKEVFFQPNSASSHHTFFRHIERAVYDALNKHRQINIH